MVRMNTATQVRTRFPQGILVSCEVPWDENYELLEDTFRASVRHAIACGFQDMYVFGTAGEGHAVDTRRFGQVLQVFAEETLGKGIRAQAGVIALSVPQFLERLRMAHDTGFRIFQISLPSWGALTDREVLTFFQDVCGAFPDSQFLHYNLPRTKRVLGPMEYRRLIDAVPNLVATKNTGMNPRATTALLRHAGELQHFFAEDGFAVGCLTGECSLLSSPGKLFPAITHQFFEYGRARQFDKLFPMMRDFLQCIDEILIEPAAGLSLMDGAYDKALDRLAGLDFPLRLLPPYEAMPDAVFARCSQVLQDRWKHWLPAGYVSSAGSTRLSSGSDCM